MLTDGQTILVRRCGGLPRTDTKAMAELLLHKEGVDPDSKDHNDRTPLWWTARKRDEAVAELLLDKKGVD